MAPQKLIKEVQNLTLLPLSRKGISTRSKNTINDQNIDPMKKGGKRKADASPIRNEKIKRSALGNLTNAVKIDDDLKKNVTKKRDILPLKKTAGNVANQVLKITRNGNNFPVPAAIPATRPTKVMTRAAARATVPKQVVNTTAVKPKPEVAVPKPATRRISNEFEKTEESLYMSALEDCSSSEATRLSINSEYLSKQRSSIISKTDSEKSYPVSDETTTSTVTLDIAKQSPPNGVVDFDKENWNDPFQISHYAMDIFNYLKSRELVFPINNYMERQTHLSKWMRTLLIDWMVEVQETFELNHETLYLAVKVVDIFLGKIIVIKDKLQLLGAAALFIACKFDERTPPLIDDFLYICDNAYNQNELIKMEMNLFKSIGYDLGIPLSYRFLRRYARCAKVAMPILTLARYILEFSLMDYATITLSDSKMASATLFIALRMNNKPGWDKTLKYYTGYTLMEFADIVPLLNANLHQKPREAIKTVRNKYSHKIFFEVAKIQLLSTEMLFENSCISYIEHCKGSFLLKIK